MTPLYLRALWQLLRFEYYLSRGGFALLYEKVRQHSYSSANLAVCPADGICRAVDVVCVLYPKQVFCLQRSAATACLLKHYGVRAQMAIGAQHMPFKSHAWVEVDGRVVNDRPYIREIYAVLDRC
jgi:hypothetical protein